MVYPNEISYLISWAKELTSKANRVRDLIGGKHWPSDGRHKEIIIRDFLSRYLPAQAVIGTGFIKGIELSTEIDILVSDWGRHPPLFNEGGLHIVARESVLAVIEVKSTFSNTTIIDAITSITKINSVARNDSSIWSGCIFSNCALSFEQFHTYCESAVREIAEESDKTASTLPKCIICFTNYICFVIVDTRAKCVELRYFDLGELSLAAGINDLFDALRLIYGNTETSELTRILEDNTQYILASKISKITIAESNND